LVEPTAGSKVPAVQLEHPAATAAEKVPARQLAQLVEPVAFWYLPAPQLRQVDEPVAGWYLPVPHPAHELLAAEEKVPAPQLLHAPPNLKKPAWQA
jgi:hypothetical protein